MTNQLPPTVLLATSIGLTMNAYFSAGSQALTDMAIPAFLLGPDAPLMPPLELVRQRKARHFQSEPAPLRAAEGTKPANSADASIKADGTRSSTNYLLRQWFHIFARGMKTYPPLALGSALAYLYCTIMLPGPFFFFSGSASSSYSSLSTPHPLLLHAMAAKRVLYALASLTSIATMVFTLTAQKPINAAMNQRVTEVVEAERTATATHNKADGETESEPEEKQRTVQLIVEWGRMNAKRAWVPFIASLFAMSALVVPAHW